VAGAGHVPMLEQPAQVNEHLLNWLSYCAEAPPHSGHSA
jgi:pimeloyl-ACP methyl ester carboxylesterase